MNVRTIIHRLVCSLSVILLFGGSSTLLAQQPSEPENQHLKKVADEKGVECVAKLDSDYESMSDAYDDMVRFMQKQFASVH